MVTIVASYVVTPNQPTPKDPLWLSNCDHVPDLRHFLSIYIYKAKYEDDTIERMRNSLSKILVHYYPVAGRLNLAESGRMEVDCNAKGVTLIEAEITKSLGDYGDFSPSESTEELVPKVDYTQPIQELPLLLVQLTKFQGGDGEGLAVGVAISHALVDGNGAIRFINSWAKLARGEELEPNEMPFLDRTVLKLEENSTAPRVERLERKPVPEIEQKEISTATFKLTSSQVDRLKKKANDQPLKEGETPYSRFESITAHIWRCASKTHESGMNHPTLVVFAVDIRNRLIPPLPQNYFGNALAIAMTPNCYIKDITSNPLSYAAKKIREAVCAVTNEYIRSRLHLKLDQERLDHIRAFFSGQGGQIMRFPVSGNYNIFPTSWMSMPVYDADFGWGKPVHFGLVDLFENDRAWIVQSSDGNCFLVNMNFQTIHKQLFSKFFYEDI